MRGYGKSGSGRGGHKSARGRSSGGGLPEKAGFPSAGLPGKSQPRDRSGGVKRCKTHPDCKGI